MWAGARFTPRWASIELLGVTVLIGALNALDRGPFADVTDQASVLAMAASSQVFVAISAITCVAFSVAMGHLRDSLRRIRENEVQLGQLLDSASGTAFIATDLDGLITWFSPGAEQLLGYTSDEVVGPDDDRCPSTRAGSCSHAQRSSGPPLGTAWSPCRWSAAASRTPATGPTYAATAAV